MNGFIMRSLPVVCLAGSLLTTLGCQHLCHCLVDPCWPERYNAMARSSVNHAFAGQVNNGHVLDQTVWNYHFEPGTHKLNPYGMQHLAYLARRRPHPDPKIYLQTAQDVPYDPAAPEKFVDRRNELDQLRSQAVLKYLQAQTANRPVHFDITVHDPSEVGMGSVPAQTTLTTRDAGFKGLITPTGATTGVGGGQ